MTNSRTFITSPSQRRVARCRPLSPTSGSCLPPCAADAHRHCKRQTTRERTLRLGYAWTSGRMARMTRPMACRLVAVALPCLLLASATPSAQVARGGRHARGAWIDVYREPAARLIGEGTSRTFAGGRRHARGAWMEVSGDRAARRDGEATSSTLAWARLALLTDTIGNRVSGSPALDRAIEWAVGERNRDGLENVHTEKVLVPKWVRGAESAAIVEPAPHAIAM